jgi:hypothetical protein
MHIKNSHSSIGRFATLNPLIYWSLNPQMPLLVKITSQEMKKAIMIKMAGNKDFHFL